MKPQNQLHLKGFSQQHLVSIQELTESIKKLPSSHIRQLGEINYYPKGKHIYPAFNAPPSCKGQYNEHLKTINIFICESKPILLHTIFHEIGHHVFSTFLTPSMRNAWFDVVRSERAAITHYASTNPVEDFAECYALYCANNLVLKAFSKRNSFFFNLFESKN